MAEKAGIFSAGNSKGAGWPRFPPARMAWPSQRSGQPPVFVHPAHLHCCCCKSGIEHFILRVHVLFRLTFTEFPGVTLVDKIT